MKFIENVIIPLIIIVTTTLFIVINPTWKMGTIYFMLAVGVVFGGASIYSFYYLFCRLFPDDRNAETPPQITMLIKMKNREQLDKDQLKIARKTTAFKLTAIFTILFICLGYYLWSVLPEKYLNYKLNKDGIATVGVVISSSRTKNDIGDHKTYKFIDLSGQEYVNYTKDANLNVGDSINVFYSKADPEKHKVWRR